MINDGKGAPVIPTGMTWSGFRPSDDACAYGYLVPSNMFAVVVLGYIVEIFSSILNEPAIVTQAKQLNQRSKQGSMRLAKPPIKRVKRSMPMKSMVKAMPL